MSARTHTRPRPVLRGGADSRLPWWALALPTLAFVTLLALILDPADAHATTAEPGITHLLERAQQLITR
ncbi:hypothetical protein ACFYY3_00100 [Streptomyces sp. NPDC001812]|uniref:Uncharacterized protein n=1 Tax=Streptomyces cathayae TaxID=3031124 RepID=A0ABY8KA83_9ACTN|nr:hypothetical protein [Streptomyces sp. HUAS 5]WGD43751.1 hypothetical protein PYS65_28415 [Streptomyces sp. HUAS 5]